jgi:hypothetical protein
MQLWCNYCSRTQVIITHAYYIYICKCKCSFVQNLKSPKILHRLLRNFDTTLHSNTRVFLCTYIIWMSHLWQVKTCFLWNTALSVGRKINTRYTTYFTIPFQSFQFQRLQFPIRLAFAITINKAQDQSFKLCGLHLHSDCFSHGQLYVACSRVGKPDNLYITTDNGTTKNIVNPQAL